MAAKKKLDLRGVRQEPSGRWGFRITMPNGKRRYYGKHPTAEDAARARDVKLGQMAAVRGGYTPDSKSLPTIGELGDALMNERKGDRPAWRSENSRWNYHVKPFFGHMRPGDIDYADIKTWARDRRKVISVSTIRCCLAVLSAIYEELRDEHPGIRNPCRTLPDRLTKTTLKDTHDPTRVPFIRKLADVRRILDALPENIARQYALGAYQGLRPAEARAVEWDDFDFDGSTLFVQRQVAPENDGTRMLKGKKARRIPIMNTILPMLRQWYLADGKKGLVVKPNAGSESKYLHGNEAVLALKKALADLGLEQEGLGYYEASRHTMASQWVMANRSIKKLAWILGHSSVVITERYSHLAPENFDENDRAAFGDGSKPEGTVTTLHREDAVVER